MIYILTMYMVEKIKFANNFNSDTKGNPDRQNINIAMDGNSRTLKI